MPRERPTSPRSTSSRPESAHAPAPVQARPGATRLAAAPSPDAGDGLPRPAARRDFFDAAFHLGPAAQMVVRMRDGVVLDASDPMLGLTGYAADALLGARIASLGLWRDDAVRRAFARDLAARGTLRQREMRLHRADGAVRTVLGDATLATLAGEPCALVSAIDITERRAAAAAEAESRTLFRTIFEASPAAISISRLDDGRFLNVNDGLADLLGRSREALLAEPDPSRFWVDPSCRRALFDDLRAADGPDAVHDVEVRLRRADAAVVTATASLQRIRLEGIDCVLAVKTDISARAEQRQALLEAKEQAEDIAHFRSALLANMTHEVRTPLTVILGFTSTLREAVDPAYERFVTLIERSGRRLLLTLDSLLDLANLEAGTLEIDSTTYDLSELLHSATSDLALLVEEKGLTFELQTPDARTPLQVDYELLRRVLQHVIHNAIKFTDEGRVAVRTTLDDTHVRIHVEDTGCGISPAFRPRLFDAFAQESEGTTRTHQGSGLGLTVSQRLTERMGGSVEVASTPDEGSTFTLVFPRADA